MYIIIMELLPLIEYITIIILLFLGQSDISVHEHHSFVQLISSLSLSNGKYEYKCYISFILNTSIDIIHTYPLFYIIDEII